MSPISAFWRATGPLCAANGPETDAEFDDDGLATMALTDAVACTGWSQSDGRTDGRMDRAVERRNGRLTL